MRKIIALITLGASLWWLSACASAPAPAETVTPTQAPAQPTLAASPTPAPVVDACLDCHTNKDTLTALAKPEEHSEGESKGVG